VTWRRAERAAAPAIADIVFGIDARLLTFQLIALALDLTSAVGTNLTGHALLAALPAMRGVAARIDADPATSGKTSVAQRPALAVDARRLTVLRRCASRAASSAVAGVS
jgi:hypothetical protein